MKTTRVDAIRKALLVRGEREVKIPNVTKWFVFTRSFLGIRADDGSLRPVGLNGPGAYWFVSKKTGSMRAGHASGTSRKIRIAVVNKLVDEGRGL